MKMPPRREMVWMKQVAVATAMAMPLTERELKSSGAVPGLAAWRARTAKLMQLPAMFPRQMKEMP